MSFELRQCSAEKLRALNTLTKYPSIETYHVLGERGRLTDQVRAFLPSDVLYLTEKIDGTNVRIIFLPDGSAVLGSRENLLWANGDLFFDPAQGIVEGMRDLVLEMNERRLRSELGHLGYETCVLYGEFYGGKVTAASKQYTTTQQSGFRLFDVQFLKTADLVRLRTETLEELSWWRESNQQQWVTAFGLERIVGHFPGLSKVPSVRVTLGSDFPTDIGFMYEYLKAVLPQTQASLEPELVGKSEGMIARTIDRKKIVKIRFEDYERTLRSGK
jgi:hypothetical protein